MAITPLVGMFAQPIWGQIADRTGARSRTLAFLTTGTALGYLGLGAASGFWPIVLATAMLALVGTAIFPMMTSVSLAILRDAGHHAFGYVRAWGTIGYFIVIMLFPWMLQNFPPRLEHGAIDAGVSQPGLGLMFPITAGWVFVAAFIAFLWSRFGHRVNLSRFFQVTAVFLAVFVVQLVIYGFHELTEANILAPLGQPRMARR